jgi:hypothetical protein
MLHDGVTRIFRAQNGPGGIDFLMRELSIESQGALPEKSIADIRSFFNRVKGGRGS